MNWQEIINNSDLIYASTLEDNGFRTWSLKKTTCNVSFYETYAVEDIDRVICGLLDSNGGNLEENTIATILGFNVVNDFDAIPKRYADKAELEIFRAVVKPILDWGLVEKDSNNYILTDLGYRAIEFGEKYKFHTGEKILLENFNIKPVDLTENLFFPFYSTLGEYSDITRKQQIKYHEISVANIFDIEETDLIKRHKLQSKELYNIYKSEQTAYFNINSCQVDIRLYKQGTEYYPIIFYKNQICIEATNLLHLPENSTEKEKKVEWGLYLKLIKDPNAVLDYKTIIPFEDLLDLDSLVKDNRFVWNDKQLFAFIAENANANQWYSISNHCPIDILKQYLQTFKDKFDWTSLSLRVDDDFLIQNATKFPWNFETISTKEDISIEVIKTLLLIPELKNQEWDWDSIMPQLDFEFIKINIDRIDFELSGLTKTNIDEVKPLIVQYPEKKWNWSYISSEYDLPYILDDILTFGKFLNLKNIINRAFVSSEYVNLFCNSEDFKVVLAELRETSLKDYSPNREKYIWNTELIDLLGITGFLTWESGTYTIGFECNPFVHWDCDYFKKYHSKIATEKGYSFVSQKIEDANIILDNLSFNWDWDTISTNTNLIDDKKFVLTVADKLNFELLLQHINSEILEALFIKSDFLVFLENNPGNWQPVTEKANIEFVRQYLEYNWDWSILTKRFCSTIKVEALGNPKWIEKWDWKYLTQNLDLKIVAEKLNLYEERWDWEYLSRKLEKEFILDNLPEYNSSWNWSTLLNERFEKQELLSLSRLTEIATCISNFAEEQQANLWQIITRKFDYLELESLIVQTSSADYNDLFKWDFSYFYDLPAFNLRNYIQHYSDFVNWGKLSCSKKLHNELFFDKKLFDYKIWINDVFRILGNSDYQWNFKELSKIDNINWCDDVLEQYITLWDWHYLSLNSSCFKKDRKQNNRIRKFQNYIDFSQFSKREDYSISEELIQEFSKKEWDWQILAQNPTIQFSAEFLLQNKDKDWNWLILSNRKINNFSNEVLVQLVNKNWDWELISERKDLKFTDKVEDKYLIEILIDKPLNWSSISKLSDINFSEEIIVLLKDKDLDWKFVSQNKTFIPNSTTLSLLKGKDLDWTAISINKNLSTEILWDYKDNLDWKHITKNEKFDVSDIELLYKYEDYLDWSFVSQSDKFQVSYNNLKQFKYKLHWRIINERLDENISEEMLESFADVLDWSNVSQSMEIHFTEELIEKFRNNWDWQLLKNNPQIVERLETVLKKYKAEFNAVEFLEQFDRKTPYIYHFTHLFNAIDIIKDRKILSRHKAEGKFANAAGSNVHRRDEAHKYARFYYRPQTLTQFYNECLGMDSLSMTYFSNGDSKSYYYDAKNNGLPRCPMPVFFKFNLKETVMKMPNKCFYSTGNMQTNWATVIKIAENPNSLNVQCLYYKMNGAYDYAKMNCNGYNPSYFRQLMSQYRSDCKQYSQQEFLVEEEFDFSNLDSFEIICYDEEHANILKAQLGNDPICEKIHTDGWDIFHRDNRQLNINETDNEISISSEYRDSAYLSIKGEGLKYIQILNPNKIQKETATEIIAYPEIRFTRTEQPIEVHFVDTTIGTRDWLVYKN